MASLALSMRMCRARNVACSRECAVRRCADGGETDGRRDARSRSFSLCREGKAAVLGRQPQALLQPQEGTTLGGASARTFNSADPPPALAKV